MQVEFEFYGTLRDAVGETSLVREFDAETTVTDAVRRVADEHAAIEPLIVRSNGDFRPNLVVSVDGEPLPDDESVTLGPSDTVVLAPGIAGGADVPTAEVSAR